MITSREESLKRGENTQFKKGVSGNPKGGIRKIPQLDVLLADVLGEEKDGIEAAKAILMALRSKAVKGDVRAAEVLLDRAYGKASQNLKLEGDISFTVPAPNVYNTAPPLSHSENEIEDV
jgi:hypothetical protein